MKRETLKGLKETKEEKIMLQNRERNHTNSTSRNNSNTFDISRSKYRFSIRQ